MPPPAPIPHVPIPPETPAPPPGAAGELFSGEAGAVGGGIPLNWGETLIGTFINNNASTAFTVQVNIRVLILPDPEKPNVLGGINQRGGGSLDPYQVITREVICAAGATTTLRVPMYRGYLHSAYISVTSGSPGSGELYAELGIASGLQTRANQFISFLSGYITSQQALSNALTNQSLITGQGALQTWEASGAATASVTQTVPAGTRWRLRWLYLLITTDANAANRRPRLRITRTAVIGDFPSHVALTASKTTTVIFSEGTDTDLTADIITAASDEVSRVRVPDIQAKAGDIFTIVFTNNQVGDTFISKAQFEAWAGT